MDQSELASQSKTSPKIICRNVESLCKKLSDDQGVHVEPEDLKECLEAKKINILPQTEFDMIIDDFLQSHSYAQLEANFKFFDKNDDGEITKDEWKQAVKKLRKNGSFPDLSKSEQKAMFEAADLDQNGKISLEEYMMMVREVPKIEKVEREHRKNNFSSENRSSMEETIQESHFD